MDLEESRFRATWKRFLEMCIRDRPHSKRLVEELQSLLETSIRKRLGAQPEQNLLLGLHNKICRRDRLLADVYMKLGRNLDAKQYLLSLKQNYQADDDIAGMIESRLEKLKTEN